MRTSRVSSSPVPSGIASPTRSRRREEAELSGVRDASPPHVGGYDAGAPRGLGLLVAVLAMIAPSVGEAAQAVAVETSTEPVITDIGPHHRRWTRQQIQQLPNGRTRTNVTSYIELQSGLHVLGPDGRWRESDPSFAILPDGSGAVAHHSLHTVAIAANLNTRGAITVQTAEGKRLVLNVIGLAWFDAATGRSQMFAQVQDSIGELHGTDTVLFRDAFNGVAADVRYMNRRDGFEQDVVLLEGVTPPQNFNHETTRIEVWNEILESPPALLKQRARAGMTDDIVDWGGMQTGPGRAFLIGEDRRAAGAHVAKRWVTTADQRSFLVEAVRYPAAKRALDQLPARQAAVNPPAGGAVGAVKDLAKVDGFNGERPFPAAPKPRPANSTDRFRTAATAKPAQAGQTAAAGTRVDPLLAPPSSVANSKPAVGYVIDYDLQHSITNLTLQCDTTYYVAGPVNLYGSPVFEGGCVIKFARTNTAQLNLNDTPVWATDQYRGVILTAKDDNTVGETIAGSTGSPTGFYGGAYIAFGWNNHGTPSHLRFSHAATAVASSGYSPVIRHAQFVRCQKAVQFGYGSGQVTLENVLAYDVQTLHAGNANVNATHVTVHRCGTFSESAEERTASLANSLFIRVTNWGDINYSLGTSSFSGSDESVFQTVGAGAHYLANGSPHRNAGSANLNSSQLAADLAQRTTHPPMVLSGAVTLPVTLSPQAQRDSDTPDRGYHYDPLDFVLGGVVVTNTTLTVQPGTALALHGTALALRQGAQFICHGAPDRLNRLARVQAVQEQANGDWAGSGHSVTSFDVAPGQTPVLVDVRFTQWVRPGASLDFYNPQFESPDYTILSGTVSGTVRLRDCQFHGGYLGAYLPHLAVTNCLFHRTYVIADDAIMGSTAWDAAFVQCLFSGPQPLLLAHYQAGSWTVANCVLDQPYTGWSVYGATADYNAYTTNLAQIDPGATHDVLLATNALTYQTGALGGFYLPTNGVAASLFNVGSTTADALGLWHYTVSTNNVRETNSVVDLGFHLVATGANGRPLDTDGDGWPDWMEDADGDGSTAGGESNWQIYNTAHGITGSVGLQVFTPLKR